MANTANTANTLPISRAARCGISCTALALAAAAAALAAPAQAADDYPSRPVRFIVGFAPGGIADLLARSLGQKLTDAFGQQVIIDNRSGGGGVISMQLAAGAPSDGHTLLMGSSTQFSINPALRPKLAYDPIRDYTPITQAALTPVVLTVQPQFAAGSLSALVQLAKAKGAQPLRYGSTGYGAAPHIAAELLNKLAGIRTIHVPYKGGSEAVTALLGGHVQLSFGAVSTSLAHVRAGRLRAIGVTSAKRLPALADVPTFAEAGFPGFEVVQWFGVFAPARVPAPVVTRLNRELVSALRVPAFREQFAAQGIELVGSTPQAFAAYVASELVRWTRVLKEIGIEETP